MDSLYHLLCLPLTRSSLKPLSAGIFLTFFAVILQVPPDNNIILQEKSTRLPENLQYSSRSFLFRFRFVFIYAPSSGHSKLPAAYSFASAAVKQPESFLQAGSFSKEIRLSISSLPHSLAFRPVRFFLPFHTNPQS